MRFVKRGRGVFWGGLPYSVRVASAAKTRLVMIYKMFEALGISTFSGSPAPPSVNPRHQPKPKQASTGVRIALELA